MLYAEDFTWLREPNYWKIANTPSLLYNKLKKLLYLICMLLNIVCTFVVVEGAKEKKSILYIKARNSLLVELSDKYNNVWHSKQNTWFFVNIYKSVP